MSGLSLLDDTDLDWITDVVDVIEACANQPWRIALERLDDTRRIDLPRAPVRFAAVVGAVQRILGGRARNAPIARATRSLTLGAPALSPAEREARIAATAAELEITCAAVEKLLWSDLPKERPVELPHGRPSELEVLALANVHLLQRAMRRAQTVTLRIWGDAGPLIRAIGARSLLATITIGRDGETVLDVVGPLALFHRTGVYGQALGSLVPLLAECDRFELTLEARSQRGEYTVHVESPVLLPSVPARMALANPALLRLAKQLAHLDRELTVTPHPPPLVAGTSLVCPDLELRRRDHRVFVELVGFWTNEFLMNKLQLYATANVQAVLCVDEARGCADDELLPDARVLRAPKRASELARQLVELMRPA